MKVDSGDVLFGSLRFVVKRKGVGGGDGKWEMGNWKLDWVGVVSFIDPIEGKRREKGSYTLYKHYKWGIYTIIYT